MGSHEQLGVSEEVEQMSFNERLELFQSRVVTDVDAAPEPVKAFAEKATRRYLERF